MAVRLAPGWEAARLDVQKTAVHDQDGRAAGAGGNLREAPLHLKLEGHEGDLELDEKFAAIYARVLASAVHEDGRDLRDKINVIPQLKEGVCDVFRRRRLASTQPASQCYTSLLRRADPFSAGPVLLKLVLTCLALRCSDSGFKSYPDHTVRGLCFARNT